MADDRVSAYMARLKRMGEQEDHINRFYVAMTDDELLDMEEGLIEAGHGMALHDPVLALYREWRDEMGTEKWSEVWAYNESQSDADKNWLLSEEVGRHVSVPAQ